MDETGQWAAVGEAVRRRMQQLGWNQADLIRESGLSDMTIRAFEKGEPNNSRTATRAKVAKALGWPADAIDRLLAGEDPDDLLVSTGRIDPATGELVDMTGLTEAEKDAIRTIVAGFKARR